MPNRDDVAGSFRDLARGQVRFECTRVPSLFRVEILAKRIRDFDPRNDARDISEVHVAPLRSPWTICWSQVVPYVAQGLMMMSSGRGSNDFQS